MKTMTVDRQTTTTTVEEEYRQMVVDLEQMEVAPRRRASFRMLDERERVEKAQEELRQANFDFLHRETHLESTLEKDPDKRCPHCGGYHSYRRLYRTVDGPDPLVAARRAAERVSR